MFRTLLFALALTPALACSPLYCAVENWETTYEIDNALLATMLAEGETDPATIACEAACEAALADDGRGTVEVLDTCAITLIDGAGDAPADVAATVWCVGEVRPACT